MSKLQTGTATVLLTVALQGGRAAVQGPPMKPWDPLPGDRDRQEQTTVTASPCRYELTMDAAIDGVMTRQPVGYAAYFQGWQPNRSVRLENTGETDVVNPWLVVNGKRRWRTLAEMTSQAVGSYSTDADKARAIWEFTRHHRFHATTWCRECIDAVKVFNVYGYTLCGDDAQIIADLWRAAGLKTRRGVPVGHCVSEVFYDGGFHLLDGDEHCIYLRRDNETIAAEEEAVRDHDLIKRTHTYGILSGDSPETDQFSASLFGYEGKREGEHGGASTHTMAYTLRPGESIEWRWDHTGKQYTAGTESPDGKWHKDGEGDLRVWGETAYSKMRNGKLRYEPDLSRDLARRGLAEAVNLAPVSADGLQPQAPAAAACATWRIASAYVIVGGKVTAEFRRAQAQDRLVISLSPDGKAWHPVWEAKEQTGTFSAAVALDDRLSLRRQPQYAYFVRVEMTAANPADVALAKIRFETDLQMSALALPELEAGRNTVEYVDETPGPRQVRITQNWVERPAWHPPAAPVPAAPADGATVQGTQVTLRWQPALHPDGVAIADYHVQLSAFQDMRWVLSPNFDKLLANTPFRGKTEWSAPFVGLLNPGTTYYWRVRARDVNQVWGPWSKPSAFSCEAPGVPLNVKATADAAAGTVMLTWEPNPKGTPATGFRVYASDEKGFTVSDTEYQVRMGRGFCKDLAEYQAKKVASEYVATPANFLAATAERSLKVVGPDLTLPNAGKCYYRVVAVDARGLRSGASDYAEAPRPFFSTRPATRVAVGQAVSYEPTVLRSIGALLCKGGYNAAFWDREELTFALAKAPAWLTLDAATGKLSGTPGPEAVGRHAIVLQVSNSRKATAEQAFELEVVRGP